MALITCKNCNKKCSDTLTKCFHCGADLIKEAKDNKIEITIESKIEEETVKSESFDSLFPEKQLYLEMEFLKTDKKIYNFRRKELEFKKISSLSWNIIYTSIIIILLSRLLSAILKNKEIFVIYNENLLIIGAVLTIVLGGIGIISLIANFISKISYNRSAKKYVFMKKFQKWLKENKNIDYFPILEDNKEKAMFNDVDLDIMDL